MSHKATSHQNPSSSNKTQASHDPVSSEKTGETEAYAKVRKLLESDRVEEAFTLARSRHDAPMKNAQAVCLMRRGKADEAVRIYRNLVLDSTGLFMKEHTPTVYKTNFALALWLSGHVSGGFNILNELSADDHPSVQGLRSIMEAWKAKLNIIQKLGLALGLEPKRPVVLDFPPGELL